MAQGNQAQSNPLLSVFFNTVRRDFAHYVHAKQSHLTRYIAEKTQQEGVNRLSLAPHAYLLKSLNSLLLANRAYENNDGIEQAGQIGIAAFYAVAALYFTIFIGILEKAGLELPQSLIFS